MILAALASALALIFAAVVAGRFSRSRRPAFAAWTLGLLIFSGAAAFQAAGEAGGFSQVTFRGFYLLGGALGVIYLALGTVFLLAPSRVAWVCAAVLAVITVVLAVDAAVIPVDQSLLSTPAGVLGGTTQHPTFPQGSPLYIGVVFLNIIGTIVLVAGSAWSAYRYFRQRAGIDRVVCNLLLTAGALIIAYGFSAAKTLGVGSLDVLGAYEAAGIAVMFAGFLSLGRIGQRNPQGSPVRSPAPTAAGSAD
ncbi:MAG: hypothetical protein ABR498_04760 [Candidatus Dormibacteria bacterium]